MLVVFNQFPKRSETFLFREFVGWRRRGLDVRALSLLSPEPDLPQEMQAWRLETLYLARLLRTPGVVARSLRAVGMPSPAGLVRAGAEVWRARSWLVTACGLAAGPVVTAVARDLGAGRLHAAWANAPAEAVRFASRALGVPYTVSVHAADLWRDTHPQASRLAGADWVLPCNAAAAAELLSGNPALEARLRLAPHAVDPVSFPWAPRRPGPPWRLLGVGRLVPKKGFELLIDTCAVLRDAGLDFSCGIVGEGPLRESLTRRIRGRGLEGRVRLTGALDHAEVAGRMAEAHALLMTSRVAADGDRDGLPNALLEGLLTGLPVVATRAGSIEEVLSDGVTGRLAEAEAGAVAAAVRALLADYGQGVEMGRAGRDRVLGRSSEPDQGEVLARIFATTGNRPAG